MVLFTFCVVLFTFSVVLFSFCVVVLFTFWSHRQPSSSPVIAMILPVMHAALHPARLSPRAPPGHHHRRYRPRDHDDGPCRRNSDGSHRSARRSLLAPVRGPRWRPRGVRARCWPWGSAPLPLARPPTTATRRTTRMTTKRTTRRTKCLLWQLDGGVGGPSIRPEPTSGRDFSVQRRGESFQIPALLLAVPLARRLLWFQLSTRNFCAFL